MDCIFILKDFRWHIRRSTRLLPPRKAGVSPCGTSAGAGWSRWRLEGLGAEAPQCGCPGLSGARSLTAPGAQPIGGHRPEALQHTLGQRWQLFP